MANCQQFPIGVDPWKTQGYVGMFALSWRVEREHSWIGQRGIDCTLPKVLLSVDTSSLQSHQGYTWMVHCKQPQINQRHPHALAARRTRSSASDFISLYDAVGNLWNCRHSVLMGDEYSASERLD